LKLPLVHNPETGRPDAFVTMSLVVVLACVVKFLVDGVTFTWGGNTYNLGHIDSMTYAALLTPVLGAHSWQSIKSRTSTEEKVEYDNKN